MSGDGQHLPGAFVRSCLLLLLHISANWLHWQQFDAGRNALQDDGAAEAVQGVLQVACNVLRPEKYAAAAVYVRGAQQQQQAVHQLMQQQVEQQVVAAAVTTAALQVPGYGSLLDQADIEVLATWQQQQLAGAIAKIVAAPESLRLHAAVLMLAASRTAANGANNAAGDAGAEAEAGCAVQAGNPCDMKVRGLLVFDTMCALLQHSDSEPLCCNVALQCCWLRKWTAACRQ